MFHFPVSQPTYIRNLKYRILPNTGVGVGGKRGQGRRRRRKGMEDGGARRGGGGRGMGRRKNIRMPSTLNHETPKTARKPIVHASESTGGMESVDILHMEIPWIM